MLKFIAVFLGGVVVGLFVAWRLVRVGLEDLYEKGVVKYEPKDK